MNNIFVYDTRIGKIALTDNGKSIISLDFEETINMNNKNYYETELIRSAYTELVEYLQGERKVFNVPIKATGTDFQKLVWKELLNIPYGSTCSYKEIAVKIGNERACRAVGLANNKNPIPIFIPCHRVIGTNGKLVGYGGGLFIKKILLNIENGLTK